MSVVLLVKIALVAVPADPDVRHPGWRAAHDVAEALDGDFLAAFDDQLIMDMADDLAEGEVSHGKAEKIPGDGLDDILYEFGTVGFDAFPFLGSTNAFIGDGFAAETIFSDAGFYIA